MRHRYTVLVMAIALGVGACTGTPLPGAARDALVAYWDGLPSDPGIEHRIVRAWEGVPTSEPGEPGGTVSEVWCVEAEMSSPSDPSVDGSRMVWIVTRGPGEATWSAALLASLSSTWPYEACGSGTGG